MGGRYFKREMQRRIFMSSPELFISRARAKRHRAAMARSGEGEGGGSRASQRLLKLGSPEGESSKGDGGEERGAARGNGRATRRLARGETKGRNERDKTGGRGGGEGREIVRGRLKRGMKRQTAADEIHNLDPMRSLYLVWNTLLFIAEIFLRYDPPGPHPHPRAPQPSRAEAWAKEDSRSGVPRLTSFHPSPPPLISPQTVDDARHVDPKPRHEEDG